jgi:hypothetical protein
MSRRFFLGGAGAMVALPATAQRSWVTYRNERFGASIDYPSDRFHATATRSNGEGRRFIAADGAAFIVSAINNVLHQTLAAIETSVVKTMHRGEHISQREHGPNWFAITGTRGDLVFHQRHLLSHRREIINDFEISYPGKLRRIYDPIAARMAASFRAGVGTDTGPL